MNNVLEWVVYMACIRCYIDRLSYLDAFCKQVGIAHLGIEKHAQLQVVSAKIAFNTELLMLIT